MTMQTVELNRIQRSLYEEIESGQLDSIGYGELCQCLLFIETPVSDVLQTLQRYPVVRAKSAYYRELFRREEEGAEKALERRKEKLWNSTLHALKKAGYARPTKEQIVCSLENEATVVELYEKAEKFKKIASLTWVIFTTIEQMRSLIEQYANTERLRQRQESEE